MGTTHAGRQPVGQVVEVGRRRRRARRSRCPRRGRRRGHGSVIAASEVGCPEPRLDEQRRARRGSRRAAGRRCRGRCRRARARPRRGSGARLSSARSRSGVVVAVARHEERRDPALPGADGARDEVVVDPLGERRVRERVDAGVDRERASCRRPRRARRRAGRARARAATIASSVRAVEHRPGVGVERDLDDGCPERVLLAHRRLGGRGSAARPSPRSASISRTLPGGAHGRPTGSRPGAVRKVPAKSTRGSPSRRRPGGDDVERRAEVDDAGEAPSREGIDARRSSGARGGRRAAAASCRSRRGGRRSATRRTGAASGPRSSVVPGHRAHPGISVRTAYSSGKKVSSSARCRNGAPLDPPVPGFEPMMRSTVLRCRNRQSWKLSSRSTSSSQVSYAAQCSSVSA